MKAHLLFELWILISSGLLQQLLVTSGRKGGMPLTITEATEQQRLAPELGWAVGSAARAWGPQ